ncbi:MAG: hypothetical protein KAY32_09660, partial [Candidatus Eisenbacteria sp.]|nr:hypothetical protein [Candidatus Eisenbacteria bacterium]
CVHVIVGPQALTGDPGIPYEWEIPIWTDSDLLTYDPIYAFEVDVLFDPAYFDLGEVVTDGGMATQGFFGWDYIGDPANGRIRMVWASDQELVNIADSRFFTLLGRAVPGAPCMEPSPVVIDTLLFNEGVPCAEITNGFFEIPGLTFGGTVTYYSCDALDDNPMNPPNPRPVPGVTIHLERTCDTLVVTEVLTGADGTYAIDGCSYCDDCVRPLADQVLESPAVTEFDAWYILQYLLEHNDMGYCVMDAVEYDPTGTGSGVPVVCDPPVGIPEVAIEYGAAPPFVLYPQRISADCSPNGLIQAYDASMILMYAVSLPMGIASRAGTWDFYCTERCYLPEIEYPDTIDDADFTAILRGDVTGDWPAEWPLLAGKHPIQVEVTAELVGDEVILRVATTELEGLYCGHAALHYPAGKYAVSSVKLVGGCSGFMAAVNDQPGDLRVAFAGTQAAPAGDYLEIFLEVAEGQGFSMGDFSWSKLRVNDNTRLVELQVQAPADVADVVWDGRSLHFEIRPSAFRGQATLSYGVTTSGRVQLTILSVDGRMVRTLQDAPLQPGLYQAIWDGRTNGGVQAPSGVYFGHLVLPNEEAVRRVIYMR